MPKLKFKTNINCGSCVKSVTPFLEADASIENWQVDTATADKILTVEGSQVQGDQVVETVQKAGFKIQPLA